jgi:Family of unknown function (DUF5677)
MSRQELLAYTSCWRLQMPTARVRMSPPRLSPAFYRWKQLEKILSGLYAQEALLGRILNTIKASWERNERNLAIFNLGLRTLYECRRLSEQIDSPNEFLAWATRNLHELHFTLQYIVKADENLEHWFGQMPADEKNIIEGFLEVTDQASGDHAKSLRNRLQILQEACDTHSLKMQRPWRVSDLAQAAGLEREYRAFYKFYSKFVHPTSWLVNGDPARVNSPMYRNLLIGLGQILVQRNCTLLIHSLALDHNSLVVDGNAERGLNEILGYFGAESGGSTRLGGNQNSAVGRTMRLV